MLTNDKTISQPDYWARIYEGKNDNAKVDASNNVRPVNTFDRFTWVAHQAEGPKVIGIGSGHAHIEKRIKAKYPDWFVLASDQTEAAKKVAKYSPYEIFSGYSIPYPAKFFTTLVISQALEYIEDQDEFLTEAKRVAEKILICLPIGNMEKWSQLYVYTEENVKELLLPYGTIELFVRHDDLLLVKLKFYE